MTVRAASAFYALLLGIAIATRTATAAKRAEAPGRMAWAHLVPWFSVKSYDVNRRDFALGMGLERWPGMSVPMKKDRLVQCRLAADAGLDAFAVDLLASWSAQHWQDLMASFFEAAETLRKQGHPFYVAPCLDGHAALGPAETASRLVRLLDAFGDQPGWPRRDGRWIVWTYNGGTFSPEQWQKVLEALEPTGHPIFLVLDLNGWLHGQVRLRDGAVPKAAAQRLKGWAKLPAAFYVFRGEAVNSPKWRAARTLLDAERSDTKPTVRIGTVWPGYWSLGYNYRAEPAGMTWLQRTFEAARAADWLCVVTWNDYVEDTYFEPSLAYGSGRLRLLREYLAEWHRRSAAGAGPAPLLVWHPCAAHVGEDLACEAATYRRKSTTAQPVRVRLQLLDADGEEVGSPLEGTLPGGPGLVFRRFAFPANLLPENGGWVRIRAAFTITGADADGGATAEGTPVPVWPSWYDPVLPRRGAMFGIGDGVRTDLTVRVETTDQGTVRGLSGGWSTPHTGGPLYLLQNWRLRYYRPIARTGTAERDFGETLSRGRQPWQVFHALPPRRRWGAFCTFSVGPDGTRHASPFAWVAPPDGVRPDCAGIWRFDEGKGTETADTGPYGSNGRLAGKPLPHWVRPGHDSPACLRFDGRSSYVELRPGRTPVKMFTVQAWVRPEPAKGKPGTTGTRCIYTDMGGFIFALDEKGRLFLQVHTPGVQKWAIARSHAPVPMDKWTHVAGTCDGKTVEVYIRGRLEGSAPGTVRFQSLTTAIGCNPFGGKGSFFRGSIDEVQLDARVLVPPRFER